MVYMARTTMTMMIVAPKACQHTFQHRQSVHPTNGAGSNEQMLSRLGDRAIMMRSRRWGWHSDHDGLGRVIVGEGRCGLWLVTESHGNQKLFALVKSPESARLPYSWSSCRYRKRCCCHSCHVWLLRVVVFIRIAVVVCVCRTWLVAFCVHSGRRLFSRQSPLILDTVPFHYNIFHLFIHPAAPWGGHCFRYAMASNGESPSQSSSRSISPPDIIHTLVQRCKVVVTEGDVVIGSVLDRDQRSR